MNTVLILKYLTLKSSLHFHRDLLNERTSHYKTHSRSLKNDYDHMSKCAKRGMVARPNKIAPVIGQSRIDCLRWNDCFTVEKKRNVSSILTSSVNAKALKRHQLANLSDQRNITNITSYDPNEIARSNQLQTIQPVKEKNKATRHFVSIRCCALPNCICSTKQTRIEHPGHQKPRKLSLKSPSTVIREEGSGNCWGLPNIYKRRNSTPGENVYSLIDTLEAHKHQGIGCHSDNLLSKDGSENASNENKQSLDGHSTLQGLIRHYDTMKNSKLDELRFNKRVTAPISSEVFSSKTKPSLDIATKIYDNDQSCYTPYIKNDDIPSVNSSYCRHDETNKKCDTESLTLRNIIESTRGITYNGLELPDPNNLIPTSVFRPSYPPCDDFSTFKVEKIVKCIKNGK